jgi:type VI protein secretion system component VasK
MKGGGMIQNLDSLASFLASVTVAVSAIGAGVWWIFRRGRKSGEDDASLKEIQQALHETQAEVKKIEARLGDVERELEGMRARRRRIL